MFLFIHSFIFWQDEKIEISNLYLWNPSSSCSVGLDKGQRYCVCGCSGLLPSIKCNHFNCKCRKRSSLHQTLSTNYTTKYNGNTSFTWNSEWANDNLWNYAGDNNLFIYTIETSSLKFPTCCSFRCNWMKPLNHGELKLNELKCKLKLYIYI